MARRAVFLDRDGTLIEDPGYLNDPDQVRLLPGVSEGLAALHRAGFLLIVVTNQSGIARGRITLEQYHAVAAKVAALTAQGGAPLTAQYFCPHLPEISGACDCRKPGLLLFQRAIQEWDIDPARSWWVGDRDRDVLPAEKLGGTGILLGHESEPVRLAIGERSRAIRVEDFAGAVGVILGERAE